VAEQGHISKGFQLFGRLQKDSIFFAVLIDKATNKGEGVSCLLETPRAHSYIINKIRYSNRAVTLIQQSEKYIVERQERSQHFLTNTSIELSH